MIKFGDSWSIKPSHLRDTQIDTIWRVGTTGGVNLPGIYPFRLALLGIANANPFNVFNSHRC